MGMSDGKVLQDSNEIWWVRKHWGRLVPFSRVGFKIQINGNTPFYRDSDLVELSASSAQVTVGGSLVLSKTTSLDIGVSEDIVINTAPDVVSYCHTRSF